MSKFEEIVAKDKCQDTNSVAKPITNYSIECSPHKRGFLETSDDNVRAISKIEKNIKIEKDKETSFMFVLGLFYSLLLCSIKLLGN